MHERVRKGKFGSVDGDGMGERGRRDPPDLPQGRRNGATGGKSRATGGRAGGGGVGFEEVDVDAAILVGREGLAVGGLEGLMIAAEGAFDGLGGMEEVDGRERRL